MIPIDQTILSSDFTTIGNCFQACIASILELPLESVPHFCAAENWFGPFAAWLRQYGLEPVMIAAKNEVGNIFYGNAYHIVSGIPPRTLPVGQLHSCVMYQGRLVHDPHPSKMGLKTIIDHIVFAVMNPVALASGAEEKP